MLYSVNLTSHSMQLKKRVINPNRQFIAIDNSLEPLFDVRCQESEDEYKLSVDKRRVKINYLEG